MIATLLNAALPLLLAATTSAAPAAARPTFRADADTVRADNAGNWNMFFTVVNPLEFGLYGDSLFVDITDLDAGVSRAPRHSTMSLPFIIRSFGAVGSKEQRSMPLAVQAPCERATIVVRLYTHTGDKATFAYRETLFAEPGELSTSMPSTFLDVQGKRVEIVVAPAVAPASAPVPARGLLLVPSETTHARMLTRLAWQFSERGVNVVAVSPPGYGLSDGPADMAGPATLAALEAALAKLAAMPGVDRKQLAVWGTGRGATAALLLAARHPEIAKVVAQDAGYDLWATWRAADKATRANLGTEAGRDSAGWKARSPLLAGTPAARVLVLHGGAGAAPEAPARAWVAARFAAQAPTDTVWANPGTHRLRKDPARTAVEFLAPAAE